MKIQHIHKDNKLIGTLVAIKDEASGKVNIGYSVVFPGDTGNRKMGIQVAMGRALKPRTNLVPKRIEFEHSEFVSHCSQVKMFSGFQVPKPEDFKYVMEPIKH